VIELLRATIDALSGKLDNSVYRQCCNIIHVGSRSLEGYVDLDKNERITGFNMCPHEKDVADLYVALVEAQLIGYESMGRIFPLDIDQAIENLHGKLTELPETAKYI
jgi:hypothetical protein